MRTLNFNCKHYFVQTKLNIGCNCICVVFFQMGGDFMLDDRGTVIFRYPCENPLDRPSVEHILQAAQQPPKV